MTEQACMQSVLSHYLDHYKQQYRLSPEQGKVCHNISAVAPMSLADSG